MGLCATAFSINRVVYKIIGWYTMVAFIWDPVRPGHSPTLPVLIQPLFLWPQSLCKLCVCVCVRLWEKGGRWQTEVTCLLKAGSWASLHSAVVRPSPAVIIEGWALNYFSGKVSASTHTSWFPFFFFVCLSRLNILGHQTQTYTKY